jgi:hypothetical protein
MDIAWPTAATLHDAYAEWMLRACNPVRKTASAGLGLPRDHTGSNVAGLIFLAECGFIGMVIVLLLGHNRAIRRSLEAATAG